MGYVLYMVVLSAKHEAEVGHIKYSKFSHFKALLEKIIDFLRTLENRCTDLVI